jgi:hypothetical protein
MSVSAASSAAASVPATRRARRKARSCRGRQRLLFCSCGEAIPAVAGLCRRCYRARAHSKSRFAGYREEVLERDGERCRTCGAGKRRLHVHHRRPGVHDPDWLVALCAACHARLHRLLALRSWLPEELIPLWAEQHPGAPLQLQFAFPPGERAA